MKVIAIGDVVGRPGRTILCESAARLKDQYEAEFLIANVENAASGVGITPVIADEILEAGVDVMTSGNHIFDKKEVVPYIQSQPRLVRPANYPPDTPGRGLWVGSTNSGSQVAVINIQGRVFMPPNDSQFKIVDQIVNELSGRVKVVIVDHHAEASSEKIAMGRFLDGRVSAVVGSHTHVQMADEQILPAGTGYITDLGMTGPHDGIIGVKSELVLARFLRALPVRFETSTGAGVLHGVVIDIDERTGKASAIERLEVGAAG